MRLQAIDCLKLILTVPSLLCTCSFLEALGMPRHRIDLLHERWALEHL